MKALIYIDAAAAVKAGLDNQGEYVIDFNPADLSKAQREELAQCPQKGKIFRTFSEFADQKDFGTGVINPDLDALKKILDAKIELRIHNEKQKVEIEKKQVKRHQQEIKRFVETSVEDRITSTTPFEFSPYGISYDLTYNLNIKEAKKDPTFQTAYEEAEDLAFWVSLENMVASRIATAKKIAEKAQREQKIAEKMKRMKKQVEIWTLANGTKSQKERLAAGLLPESEIVDAIRSAAYAPLDKFPRFKKLKTTDVCNDDSGWENHKVKFQSKKAEVLTEQEFDVMKKIQKACPKNATVKPLVHTAICDDCDNIAARLGFMVKIQVEEFSFSREYGLNP